MTFLPRGWGWEIQGVYVYSQRCVSKGCGNKTAYCKPQEICSIVTLKARGHAVSFLISFRIASRCLGMSRAGASRLSFNASCQGLDLAAIT